jgi:hypothetical protein
VLLVQVVTRSLRLPPQAAILQSMTEFLALPPGAVPERTARQLMEAAQQLLESEDTSPRLLPLILPLLQRAAAHPLLLQAHFHDIVDLLLGWSLEPLLTPACRWPPPAAAAAACVASAPAHHS